MVGKELAVDLFAKLEREAEPEGRLLNERRCLLWGRCEVAECRLYNGRHFVFEGEGEEVRLCAMLWCLVRSSGL